MVNVAPNFDNEAFSNFGIDRRQAAHNCMTFAGDAMDVSTLMLRYDDGSLQAIAERGGHQGRNARQQIASLNVDVVYALAADMEGLSGSELETFLEERFFNHYENGERNRGLHSTVHDANFATLTHDVALATSVSTENIISENQDIAHGLQRQTHSVSHMIG